MSVHPRDRLRKKTKNIKPVTVHPRHKLKKATNKHKYPRNRIKNIESKIGRQSFRRLMREEFNFSSKKILNKTLIFDATKINEEITMDKITEALNDKTNDEFYIKHPPVSIYFTLKREDGR